MLHDVWIASLLLGGAATLASVAGAALVLIRPRAGGRHLDRYLALSAGFLLAVALLELVPGALGVNEHGHGGDHDVAAIAPALASFLILAGFISLHFVEKLVLSQHVHVHHDHIHLPDTVAAHTSGRHHHGEPNMLATAALTMLFGMGVHTFFDGISIGAGLAVSPETGLLIFLAVLLHKLPDGFVIGSLVLAAGGPHRQVLQNTLILGGATLLGALAATALIEWGGSSGHASVEILAQYGLAFAAGVFVYVAASDLIPEVTRREDRMLSLWTLLGIALFIVAEKMLM